MHVFLRKMVLNSKLCVPFLDFQSLVTEVIAGNAATVILAGAPNEDMSSYILSRGGCQSALMKATAQMLEACENRKGSSVSFSWCKVNTLFLDEIDHIVASKLD